MKRNVIIVTLLVVISFPFANALNRVEETDCFKF